MNTLDPVSVQCARSVRARCMTSANPHTIPPPGAVGIHRVGATARTSRARRCGAIDASLSAETMHTEQPETPCAEELSLYSMHPYRAPPPRPEPPLANGDDGCRFAFRVLIFFSGIQVAAALPQPGPPSGEAVFGAVCFVAGLSWLVRHRRR
jgi:hypothetical protein